MMTEEKSAQIELFMQNSSALLGAIHQPLNDPLTKLVETHQAGEGLDSFLSQTAAGASPAQVETEEFLARNPYANHAQLKADIEATAQRGWSTLSQTGFTGTQKAQDFSNAIIQLLADDLTAREAQITDVIPQAVELLGRLVENAHNLPGFNKTNLAFSRNFEYEDKTPSLLWVRRHLVSLGAYRDDCHTASWQDVGLSGREWEALTFIWQDNAHTAEELAEALQFRNFSQEDYAAALDSLADRGLIELQEGQYQMTDEGTRLRQQAEDKTNQLYQQAFEVLTEKELAQLNALLADFAAALSVEDEMQVSA